MVQVDCYPDRVLDRSGGGRFPMHVKYSARERPSLPREGRSAVRGATDYGRARPVTLNQRRRVGATAPSPRESFDRQYGHLDARSAVASGVTALSPLGLLWSHASSRTFLIRSMDVVAGRTDARMASCVSATALTNSGRSWMWPVAGSSAYAMSGPCLKLKI